MAGNRQHNKTCRAVAGTTFAGSPEAANAKNVKRPRGRRTLLFYFCLCFLSITESPRLCLATTKKNSSHISFIILLVVK